MRSKLEDLKELRDLVRSRSLPAFLDRPRTTHTADAWRQVGAGRVLCTLCAVRSHESAARRWQVRSLGRGGGWGPLRRAPIQHLDMKGRPGLLRTVLEQQETRGLTRADDLSRLLPSEVPGPSTGSVVASRPAASSACCDMPALSRSVVKLTFVASRTGRAAGSRPHHPPGQVAVLRQAGGEGAVVL